MLLSNKIEFFIYCFITHNNSIVTQLNVIRDFEWIKLKLVIILQKYIDRDINLGLING